MAAVLSRSILTGRSLFDKDIRILSNTLAVNFALAKCISIAGRSSASCKTLNCFQILERVESRT
eukprot:618027-Amphidinium_carterae.1